MSPRRALVLALAALAACTDVKQDGAPAELVTVALYSPPRDPANCAAPAASPNIPLPNDLALQRAPGLPDGLQKELLLSFITAGGWPSDQVQPFTLPIYRRTRDASGNYVPATGPAGIDTATLNDSTVALLRVDGPSIERLPFTASYVPPAAGAPAGTPGVLRLTPASGPWPAGGRFVASIRGGDAGVKTSNGVPLGADSPIALVAPNKNLKVREFQPLGSIPDAACSPAGNTDEIETLETLRGLYGTAKLWVGIPDTGTCTGLAGIPAPCWLPGAAPAGAPSAFDAVATVFPHAELAAITTFTTQAGTRPVTDAAGGTVPLPSDFLLDPATGKVRNIPTFGPAAAGLATLDGFSTTATHLIPLSGPVSAAAASVNHDSVRIYDLTGGVPTQLRDQSALPAQTPQIVTQPPQFNQDVGGQPVAGTLALAPAVPVQVPVAVSPTQVVPVPPLKERTRYLVIVTNDVVDVTGAKLKRSTLMDILFTLTSPIYSDGGTPSDPSDDVNHAAGLGLSSADARGLQAIRDGLSPVLTALGLKDCSGTNRCAVLAYTVTTQSVTGVSLQLAAAPYAIETGATPAQAIFTPTAATAVTPPGGTPTANVAAFYDVTFKSVDAIDKTTGALRPTLADDLADPAVLGTLLTDLHALVAVPAAASVPACPSPPFPAGARCAKLVVVGHGLNGSKEALFAVASSLASQGFLAAAIDFPLHGARNWCSSNADCTTDGTADGVCTPFEGGDGQGDATPPGTCTTGVPRTADSRYFATANFFRLRDAFRQNVLDQSALALALSRPPASQGIPQPPGNPLTAQFPAGVVTDPSAVYYGGISLGSIAGTSVVATNPRISRAVLSVGGGTFVDVATNSSTYQDDLDAVLASIIPGYTRPKVTPGDPAFDPAVAESYVQTLAVAKWVLDPADPINYAAHVRTAPLPNLLTPDPADLQLPKDTFAQVAKGDTVVPNPFNFLLDQLIADDLVVYVDDDPAGGNAPHGMLGSIAEVQADAAQYLLDLSLPTLVGGVRPVPVP
jgi:hypothetical protein